MAAWLFYIVSGFLLIRLVVAGVNLLSKSYLRLDDSKEASEVLPSLSVLIPLRNEERNIDDLQACLEQQHHWPDMEILLLDDQSTDKTWNKIQSWAAKNTHVRAFEGKQLPEGWLGKNWACHQLSQQARGEYWLFIDADVRMRPEAVIAASRRMCRQQLDLLSIFPDQEMKSLGEKLVVPLMHYLLLSLLPLRLIYSSRNPAFAAANGQFMLFRSQAYGSNEWHAQVRTAVTEDIAIQKAMKKAGLKTETLLAGGLVSCRMYSSYTEAVRGFSKNYMAFFGWNPLFMLFYLILSIACYPVFLLSLPVAYSLILLAGVGLLKFMISYMSRQPIGEQLILQLPQMLVSVQVSVLSAYRTYTRTNTWKGRKL